MTDVVLRWSTAIISSPVNYDWQFTRNGVNQYSGTSRTTAVTILCIPIGCLTGLGNISVKIGLKIQWNSGAGSISTALEIGDQDNTGPNFFLCENGKNASSSSDVDITCRYNRRGLTGPPTYLEELSKLDQYTKAQYIPNIR